ncbi:Outer membrane protein [Candidatus Terasakiella magnetica]|nr:Outer membrane protein [Candidatus Terasakiella magnetica]
MKIRYWAWVAILISVPMPARATSISAEVYSLLDAHPRIESARHEMNAAAQQVKEAVGKWFPDLELTEDAGRERYHRDATKNTVASFHQLDVRLTQKIWDFGKTNSDIRAAEYRWKAAKENFRAAEHTIIYDAVSSYLNLMKSYRILDYSKKSEENIKRQANLESAMVVSGRGYQTDVLQAKAQLSGAEARRVRAEGVIDQAVSHYQAVFMRDPPGESQMAFPRSPDEKLYRTRDQAIEAALRQNPQLASARMTSRSAKETALSVAADKFTPVVKGIVESTHKNNVAGLMGYQSDQVAKVQISFPFNLGFTSMNSVSAAVETHSATVAKEGTVRISLEEQVKGLFKNLDVQKKNAGLLHNQATLSQQFLEMAREERKINRRSLIDILQGETQLYNAESDAYSADIDVIISTFALLQATGDLTSDLLEELTGANAGASIALRGSEDDDASGKAAKPVVQVKVMKPPPQPQPVRTAVPTPAHQPVREVAAAPPVYVPPPPAVEPVVLRPPKGSKGLGRLTPMNSPSPTALEDDGLTDSVVLRPPTGPKKLFIK